MNVDEFLVWAEAQEGRYELESGGVIAMSPERALHVRTKFAACSALADAIRWAGLPREAFIEGLAVRIGEHTSYEPDVLVQCGGPLADDARVADNPVIVVEVLSPGTSYRDLGVKLTECRACSITSSSMPIGAWCFTTGGLSLGQRSSASWARANYFSIHPA